MMIAPSELQNRRSALDDLQSMPFDFDMINFKADQSWLAFDPPLPFRIIAGDYCGGSYVAYGPEPFEAQPLFHVSSEGFSRRLGDNLTDALEHLVSIPNWRDAACREVDQMEQRIDAGFAELDEMFPVWRTVQARLRSELQLDASANHVVRLHASLTVGGTIEAIINGEHSPTEFRSG